MVLSHAAKIAAASGARVIAAHVIPTGTIREWERASDREAHTAERVEELTGRLEAMMAEHCPGVAGGTEVRIGKPAEVLARVLTDHRAGLLVIGAHDVTKRRLGCTATA